MYIRGLTPVGIIVEDENVPKYYPFNIAAPPPV